VVRILPIALVVLGVGFHFFYCEWAISDAIKYDGPTAYDRVIFAHHRRGFEPRRGLPNHMVLFARSDADREDAMLYGLLLPGLAIGGALLIWRAQKEPHTRDAGYA